jgi:hypothetical protein
MFRVGKHNENSALKFKGTEVMMMGAKRMGGFIFIKDDDCPPVALSALLGLALGYVQTLPAK